MAKSKKSQSGQILLITLLVLSFVAIVVLSLISRTTTSQKITTQIDHYAKALSAAEAGLELALQSHQSQSGTTETGVNFSVSGPIPIGTNNAIYALPETTPKGELAVVWLARHNLDGSLNENPAADYEGSYLDACWEKGKNPRVAVVATLLYKKAGNFLVAKSPYDSDNASRDNSFSFDTGGVRNCGDSGNFEGQRLIFSTLVSGYNAASDTLIALRLRPIYNSSRFRVQTEEPFRLVSQGDQYIATGLAVLATSVVEAGQLYPAPGAIFDYVIYSQSGNFAQ